MFVIKDSKSADIGGGAPGDADGRDVSLAGRSPGLSLALVGDAEVLLEKKGDDDSSCLT